MNTLLLWLSTADADAAQRPLLLWEVRKGDDVSWLMGTCHVPIPMDHALPKPYDERLRGARVYVSELDIQALMEPRKLLAVLIDPERDLRRDIGEDSFRAYSTRLKDLFPAPALVRMQPWVFGSLLEVARWGVPGSLSLDEQLAAHVKESGVPRGYLETVDEQLSMMESLNDEMIAALKLGSQEANESDELSTLLGRACVDAELGALEALLEASGDTLKAQLETRNEAWNEVLLQQLAEGDAFFAVGVGHMVGPTGLVAQAERAGYTVKRLSTRRKGVDVPVREPMGPIVPPEPDPEKTAAWNALIASGLPKVCEGPASCLVDAATCQAQLSDAIGMCVDQQLSSLPAQPDQASTVGVFTCAFAGLVLESLVSGAGADTPSCEEMRASMWTAMEGAIRNR